MDADGDGDISVTEMKNLLISMKVRLHLSNRDIDKILKEFDQDGDGTVDTKEFLDTIQTGSKRNAIHKALIQRNGIRKAFNSYDKDNNGYIT